MVCFPPFPPHATKSHPSCYIIIYTCRPRVLPLRPDIENTNKITTKDMKKLSTILCTLALLFTGVGGGKVYAGKYYATINQPDYVAATWESETNTMSWTGVWATPSGGWGSWFFLQTGLPNGNITSYTKFHATLSNFSENVDHIWLRIKQGDNNYADVKLIAGENEIDLAALAEANP